MLDLGPEMPEGLGRPEIGKRGVERAVQVVERPAEERSFRNWSMAFRQEERLGEFDSFPQTLHFLTRQIEDIPLRRQIELFARSFIADPANEEATPWGSVA